MIPRSELQAAMDKRRQEQEEADRSRQERLVPTVAGMPALDYPFRESFRKAARLRGAEGRAERVRLGDLLDVVRTKLDHGSFAAWCEWHGVNDRTARRYIRLARAAW